MTETHTLTEFGVTRDSDGASIPKDDNNRDWVAYQEWLKAGNTPAPYFKPEKPPKTAEEAAVTSLRAAGIAALIVKVGITQAQADALFGPPNANRRSTSWYRSSDS